MPITREAPNGEVLEFPDGTTEEQINSYLKKSEFQVQGQEPKDVNLLSDIASIPQQAIGGVFDGVNSSIQFAEGLGDTLGERTNIGGIVLGKAADNGYIGYKSYEELKKEGVSDIFFGKYGEIDTTLAPELERNTGVASNFARGISQFVTGWVTGGRILKGAGVAVKPSTFAGSLTKGAIADTIAFDGETGRMTDLLVNYAPSVKDTWLGYLASDKDDTFWEGRFKNAIEGLALGGVTESVFRGYRYLKNKNNQRLEQPFNEKQIAEDEAFFADKTEENLLSQQGVKITSDGLDVKARLKDNFERVNSGQLSINESLDIGFNTISFRALSKDGLKTLDEITKSLSKQIEQIQEPQVNAILYRRAERMYDGDIAKVLNEGEELAGAMDRGRYTIVAHEVMTQSLSNYFPKLVRAYKQGLDNVTRDEVKNTLLILDKAFLNTKAIRTSWGRIGQVFQIAKDKALGFDDLRSRLNDLNINYNNISRNLEGKQADEAFDAFIDQAAKLDEPTKIHKVLDWVGKNQTWEVLNEVWINSLLSSPKTHAVNLLGNTIQTFIRPLEVAIGSKLRFSVAGFGENAAKVAGLKQQGRNAYATFAGLIKYLDEVNKYTMLAFKNEDTIISGKGNTKLDTGAKATGDNAVGKIIRTPSRFLNAEDEFFKQINGRAKLYQLGVEDALAKNKSIDKIVGSDPVTKKPITEFQAHVIDFERKGFDETGTILTNPDAIRYMEESTFQQALQGIPRQFQDAVNKYPIMKQLFPFVKTPLNLISATLDRVPFSFLFRKQFRDELFGRTGNYYRTAEARGKQATGGAIMALAHFVLKDRITGGEPTNEFETNLPRDLQTLAKTKQNFVPYSLRIGDKYYSFGRLDPFGALLGIIADTNRYYEQLTKEDLEIAGSAQNLMLFQEGGENNLSTGEKIQNLGKASWSGLTKNIFSKTYLQSLSELVQIATDDDTYTMDRWVSNKIGSYIPNIYTKLINDPYYKETDTVLSNAKKRAGYQDVQLKYNFLGEPIEYSGDEGERLVRTMIDPFGTTPVAEPDVVVDEVIRLGQNIAPIKKFLDGKIDMTQFVNPKTKKNAYDRFNELYGQTDVYQELKNLIESEDYQLGTDPVAIDLRTKDKGTKFQLIKDTVAAYRAEAKAKLYEEMTKFVSIQDNKLDMETSYNRAFENEAQIKSGVRVSDELKPLYKLKDF